MQVRGCLKRCVSRYHGMSDCRSTRFVGGWGLTHLVLLPQVCIDPPAKIVKISQKCIADPSPIVFPQIEYWIVGRVRTVGLFDKKQWYSRVKTSARAARCGSSPRRYIIDHFVRSLT